MDDLILVILVGLAVSAVRIRDLLGAVAVLGAYSLVMAILWCHMNAVDVGFTEAAVGAGISTVLMLAAVARIGRHERAGSQPKAGAPRGHPAHVGAILVVLITAGALLYGTRDMPAVGETQAPATVHPYTKRWYLEVSPDVAHAGCRLWTEVEHTVALESLDVALIEPTSQFTAHLGSFETDAEGRGRLDLDGSAFPIPTGMTWTALEGKALQVVDRRGDVLLTGLVPGPSPPRSVEEPVGAGENVKHVAEGVGALVATGHASAPDAAGRIGFRCLDDHGEIGPANVVTSVLGDYRGYDTLGETVVIFTAGLCVVLLLRQAQSSGRREERPSPGGEEPS